MQRLIGSFVILDLRTRGVADQLKSKMSNVPGIVAFAQAQPKLRRSLLGMPLNDPIISAWRDAVRMLKEPTRPAPINWASLANIQRTASGFKA